MVIAQLGQPHLQHVHVLPLLPAGERPVLGRPVFRGICRRGRRGGQRVFAQGGGVERGLERHRVFRVVVALVDGDDRALLAVFVNPFRVGDEQADAAVGGGRAQRVEGFDGEGVFVRLGIEHGVEGVGRVDARQILRVGAPCREVAPASALFRHDGRFAGRGVFARAGGADHFAHEHGILAVLVVCIGAGDLVDDVHHQGVFCRFGRGGRSGRGLGGDGGGGKEQLLRVAPRDAVSAQAVVRLKGLDGGLGHLVIAAGDLRGVKAQFGQAGLELRDPLAGIAVFERPLEGEVNRLDFGGRFGLGGRFDGGGRFGGNRRGHEEIFVGRLAVGGDELNVAVVAQDDPPRLVLPEDCFAQTANGNEPEQTEEKREMFHGNLREMSLLNSGKE